MFAPIEIQRIRLESRALSPIRRVETYEFTILLSGGAELFSAGRKRFLGVGHGGLVVPGESRALGGSGRDSGEVLILSVDPAWALASHLAPIVESLSNLIASDRIDVDLGYEIAASVKRKGWSVLSGSGLRGDLRAALLESLFIDLSVAFLGGGEARRITSAPLWLRRACVAMERSANLRRGGHRLAELAGKSPEHVIRQMRRYYDMTPTEFVNDIRLRKASEFLAGSRRPILDISYSLGFENPSYFSRLFKEKYGMSPTHFRAGRRE